MLTMYAIANCDTVKKARAFLEKKKITYEFVDFKKRVPTSEEIMRWEKFWGEIPANKKGITYKKYKAEFEALTNDEKVNFLIKNTSMIKRPILEMNKKTLAMGFDEENYNNLKF